MRRRIIRHCNPLFIVFLLHSSDLSERRNVVQKLPETRNNFFPMILNNIFFWYVLPPPTTPFRHFRDHESGWCCYPAINNGNALEWLNIHHSIGIIIHLLCAFNHSEVKMEYKKGRFRIYFCTTARSISHKYLEINLQLKHWYIVSEEWMQWNAFSPGNLSTS